MLQCVYIVAPHSSMKNKAPEDVTMPHAAGDHRRVLVVEDELFIGMDLADELEGQGFSVAGPVKTSAAALAWLADNTPDLVILDVWLRDSDCLDVARELRRKRVPFVFFTGDPRWPPLQTEFADIRCIGKPARLAQLLAAADQAPPCALEASRPVLRAGCGGIVATAPLAKPASSTAT